MTPLNRVLRDPLRRANAGWSLAGWSRAGVSFDLRLTLGGVRDANIRTQLSIENALEQD